MYNICLLIDRRTRLCNALIYLRYLRSAKVNILVQTTLSSLWLDSCSSENIGTKLHGTREAKTIVTDAMKRPERETHYSNAIPTSYCPLKVITLNVRGAWKLAVTMSAPMQSKWCVGKETCQQQLFSTRPPHL
ncbi:hypothetical protein Bpfe_020661 [Biomphalaria pfeifferi]|uniref:Uncharacterized protein n=1 Tax=Biomphalaria pfeifferi TaxID=112525 RepID=A0AAD8B9Q5_BIOPF|nr:hypothetical protein Bpfe_020661 [Biomphalaria pfeifferi]